MIGYLDGEVLAVEHGVLTLLVGGVGYDVTVPSGLANAFPGASLQVFVHTHVREDALILYGFTSSRDREMFRLLLSTPGVGPSTAVAALSTMNVDALMSAILGEDVAAIATIPGIGKKTASRLVLELAGRLPETPTPQESHDTNARTSVEAALKSLGYGVLEIREALDSMEIPSDEGEALRRALRQLSTR